MTGFRRNDESHYMYFHHKSQYLSDSGSHYEENACELIDFT